MSQGASPITARAPVNLLVVVNNKDLTDAIYWLDAEERITRTTMETTPVTFIVHSLGEVNEGLERGRCFFVDFLDEGIGLCEKLGHPFRKPKPLAPAAAVAEAKAAFDRRYPMAVAFACHSEQALSEGDLELAAFLLHQAAERLYTAYMQAQTLYRPKTHSLRRLCARGLPGRAVAARSHGSKPRTSMPATPSATR